MTGGGWMVMLVSVGAVTTAFAWCLWKVLTTPRNGDNVHGFEFETPDAADSRTQTSGPE